MRRVRASLDQYNEITDQYNQTLRDNQAKRDVYRGQVQRYRTVLREEGNKAALILLSDLQKVTSSSFVSNIDVDVRDYGYVNGGQIIIEYGRKENKAALNWHWTVSIKGENEVKNESGSWSGLNATTVENIQELQLSVQALKFLQECSNEYWLNLVDDLRNVKFEDYVTEENVHDPDKVQVAVRQLEALVGTDKWVEAKKPKWYLEVLKSTNSMFFYEEYYKPKNGLIYSTGSRNRMNKEKFVNTMVNLPLVVTSQEEVQEN